LHTFRFVARFDSMAVFWILTTLMTAVALAFVLVPLLRARPAAAPSAAEANLQVLRAQRREIDADVESGVLPREARDAAVAELVQRADEDLAPTEAPIRAGKPWAVIVAVFFLVPLVAFGTYLAVGTPRAADPAVMAAMKAPTTDAQIVAMVERLAEKVKERPDDVQGWSLLARSMAALGRFKESSDAYEHLSKLVPDDPQVYADWADALGMAQGKTLRGKPYELAKQALKLDPDHRKALALAGTAAMDAGDYASSARYWATLASQMAPGSQEEAQVRAIIAEVQEKAAAAGKPIGELPKQLAQAKAAPAGQSVSGSVSISPQIASRLQGNETLFIFARAEGGSRMPLAIMRVSAKELPLKFALDDSQSMAPGANISSAQALRVEARISQSGNAAAQPGDLVGTSAVVKPGARGVKVVVDKVLP